MSGQGGVYAHLGTRDLREVEARARSGDERATLLMEAMIYLFAKYIASLAPVVDGPGGGGRVASVAARGSTPDILIRLTVVDGGAMLIAGGEACGATTKKTSR